MSKGHEPLGIELDDEIAHHLDERRAELERRGMSPRAARSEALRRFGDLAQTRDACLTSDRRRERQMLRRMAFEDTWRDLGHGMRQLARRPGFASASVLTLAVGIGATTAVFSAAHHVLLRPLPYHEPAQVVTLWEVDRDAPSERYPASPGNFLAWRERSRSFAASGLVEPYSFDLTAGGHPVSVASWLTSDGFFEALGVQPLLGRLFAPEEYRPNAPFVVLVSEKLWRSRFGGDVGIVGSQVQLDGETATVVGVLPASAEYPQPRGMWAPKAFREGEELDRTSRYQHAVARLRAGVDVEQAQVDLERIAVQLAREHPRSNAVTTVSVVPLREQVTGAIRPAIAVLLGAVALVLLIACGNVANLMLARGAERRRELSVRAALGAGRGRLLRQMLAETGALALAGGGLGVLLAWQGARTSVALIPPELSRLAAIRLDPGVLAFAAGLMLLTVVLCGLAPALHYSRTEPASAIRGVGRALSGRRDRPRLQSSLVVGGIAMALVLLIGANLLARSFSGLLSQDTGFEVADRVALQVFTFEADQTPEQRLAKARRIRQRLAVVPGVEAVEIVSALPFLPSRIDAQSALRVEGRAVSEGSEDRAFTTIASEGYFQAMGVPLLAGRFFDERDTLESARVALISETLRRRVFPGEDPVGRRVTVGVMSSPVEREIVGVVGDVRPTSLESSPQAEIFIPYEQSGSGYVTFVVHTAIAPDVALPALREALWSVEPGQSIYHEATLEGLVGDTLVTRRFVLTLFALFAGIALLLATIGVYGLISLRTAQRVGEIGLRIALGADRRDVIAMVVRQAMRLVLPGIALGTLIALAATRLLESMLYGVTATHPATYGQVALLVVAISALSAFLPARRAAAADPLAALREE